MGADPKVYFSRKGAKKQSSKDYITTLRYSYYAIFALCRLEIRSFASLRLCEKNILFSQQQVRNDY
jgi:ribosomal protein S14